MLPLKIHRDHREKKISDNTTNNKMPKPATIILPLIAATALFVSGCATTIKVTSAPPGAQVRYRGEGRAAFRWQDAPTVTPTEIKVYYGRISAYAFWEDGPLNPETGKIPVVLSVTKELKLSSVRDTEELHFIRPSLPTVRE